MLVGVEEAQERFEELMARTIGGEEILIADGARIAKLVPVDASRSEARRLTESTAAIACDLASGENR